MRLSYGPNGMLQIDDARITFKNFSGTKNPYNRDGKRTFSVIIDDEEIAQELQDRGWNVKIKPPYEPGDLPFMYLEVKVSFNEFGPKVMLVSGGTKRRLFEDNIGCLDKARIERVDLLDIAGRPYENINGRSGISAWLRCMEVHQAIDRFDERYGDFEDGTDAPF